MTTRCWRLPLLVDRQPHHHPAGAGGLVPRAVATLSERLVETDDGRRPPWHLGIAPPTRTLPSLDNLGCRESCPAYQQIYEQVRAKDDVSFKTPQSGPSNLGSGNLDSRQDRSCLG